MTLEEIRQVEAPEVHRARQVRKGDWHSYIGISQAGTVLGQAVPTFTDRCLGYDWDSDNIPLSLLNRHFQPDPAVVDWVQAHVSARSREGPRDTAKRFWHKVPGRFT